MADEIDTETGIIGASERAVEERVRDFSELLKGIKSLDEKKQQLWKEIYENAIIDRQNSYAMFTKLVRISKDQSTEHAIHGKSIATYISGMSKANDQLIKLAELIAKAQENDDNINPDEMFDKIQGT